VPAYFYLTSDGELPHVPPGGTKVDKTALTKLWYDQSRFVDGLAQETCRDFGHTQYGLAAMINAAETARQQGVDLYGEVAFAHIPSAPIQLENRCSLTAEAECVFFFRQRRRWCIVVAGRAFYFSLICL
jgi:hypothetical protein